MAGKIQYIKKLDTERCGYWPGEERLSAHFALVGTEPAANQVLLSAGRIHTLLRGARLEGVGKGFLGASFGVIAPACPACNACVPLRVNTDKFVLSASQRKLLNDGRMKYAFQETVLLNPHELFRVFKTYVSQRHDGNAMSQWNMKQFRDWLGFMPFTLTARDKNNQLVGFSSYEANGQTAIMEYAAYNPALREFSIGKRLWIEAVRQAQETGITYVYVGSWAKDSPKLGYKSQHRGLETYVFDEQSSKGQWVDFDPDVHTAGPNYRAMLRAEGFDI